MSERGSAIPAPASLEGVKVKTYTVMIGGLPHTMQLSDEDAKARGLTADEPKAEAKQASAPNKARKAVNKSKS